MASRHRLKLLYERLRNSTGAISQTTPQESGLMFFFISQFFSSNLISEQVKQEEGEPWQQNGTSLVMCLNQCELNEMMHSCIMCLFLSTSLLLPLNGVDESSCILYGTRKQNMDVIFICHEQTENRSLWMTNIFKYKLTYSYSHSVVRHDCALRWFPGQRQDKAQMEKLVAG